MAGTRLAIHLTFMIEVFVLVIASFLYATKTSHDPFSSAEPFLADRTGWQILNEDVSLVPSPDDGNFIDQVGECVAAVVTQISKLLGLESESHDTPNRPRRPSLFVQEMRQKIAPFVVDVGVANDPHTTRYQFLKPSLNINLRVPQLESPATLQILAESLERKLRSLSAQETTRPEVRVTISASSPNFSINSSENNICDHFKMPNLSNPRLNASENKLDYPEIIILMGCSRTGGMIPNQKLSSVEVDFLSGTIVVRSVLTIDQKDELQYDLVKEITEILSDMMFVPLSQTPHYRRRNNIESVSIELVDEDPASHAGAGRADGDDGITAKFHFDTLGKALSSAVQSTIRPLIEDLSLVSAGGDIAIQKAKGSVISLEAHSSAYLSLSDDHVKFESVEEDDSSAPSVKYVSSDSLAKWIQSHSSQQKQMHGHVKWTLFVPSHDKTPLMIQDESSGQQGKSIILSSPLSDRMEANNSNLSGMSIVNLPSLATSVKSNDIYNDEVEQMKMQSSYEDELSQSLMYLVGFIRATYGLETPLIHQSALGQQVKYHSDVIPGRLSFWELEAIAQSHYYASLELAFSDIDALLAVLHEHGASIALPKKVADKLNNATNLLRQSISVVEDGFPTIYASSLLHGALHYLDSVQNDHQFMELPYFAPDHYLAVFSPLILPLLLPMIVGLIREVKRFRELRQKLNG